MSFEYILAYIIVFFILYIFCWLFLKPIKWFLRLLLNCVLGCAIMLILNNYLPTNFALNPLTAMTSGVLGIPGIIMTYIFQGIL